MIDRWWYLPIIPAEQSFPASCRQTLVAFLTSISNHLARKRHADALLDFLTNSSSILIVFLSELATAMQAAPHASASDAVHVYLQVKPDSNLAHVLDKHNQKRKLDLVSEDILQNFLDPKTYNCKPAHVFLQQVCSQIVLEYTIQTCQKPEWLNDWIVYLLEGGEPELLKEIDETVGEATGNSKMQNLQEQLADKEQTVRESQDQIDRESSSNHKRVVSRAQEAMDDAMQEAQRLTQLIAEEDARRQQEQQLASTSNISEASDTTQGEPTPTSSQSDENGEQPALSSGQPSLESSREIAVEDPPPSAEPTSVFTSFDQLVPPAQLGALDTDPGKKEPEPLTLHNATLSIFDDAMPGEKAVSLRQKPSTDYLIQIEPPSSQHPGWMIARKYADFETLHEIMKRISVITGCVGFNEAHTALPNWKVHTKASLRGELERYLNDAVHYQQLAESEGMKRFLEKDTGLSRSPGAQKKGLAFPTPQAFQSAGKGMMDVLTKAPGVAAGGGKALMGGVTGVVGGIGALGKRRTDSQVNISSRSSTQLPYSPQRTDSTTSIPLPKQSNDSVRTAPVVDTQPSPVAQMERRPSWNPEIEGEKKAGLTSPSRSSLSVRSGESSKPASTRQSLEFSPGHGGDQMISLPPPPSEITDDFDMSPKTAKPIPHPFSDAKLPESVTRTQTNELRASSPSQTAPRTPRRDTISTKPLEAEQPPAQPSRPKKVRKQPPLTESETTVVIDLLFAVINELYTLSSAWNIRRTLLQAAKTFLLRPGNPQLESIRQLIQTSVLDENTGSAGIAVQLRKLRANTMPTEEERATWPAELNDEQKEALRVRARKLLVERGMPAALTSVMGQAASGEALGKLFDCLQIEDVSRGLIFGLLLQGVRAITQ